MARGNTAVISVVAFKAQWDSHIPIRALCENFTISRDQVTRLKFVWNLAPRHDRRKRFKPERQPDPTPQEIARACLELQAQWSEEVREERCVIKRQPVTLKRVELSDEARNAIDSWGDE